MSKAITQLEKFWKNKKVFVTGHTGFKGTWLIIFLNLFKAKIYGFALKAPKISIFNQTKSYKILKKNFYLNINNLSSIKRALNKSKPQIIFHLAAQPLVSKSYQDPLNTFSTNVMGTSNLLEAIREIKSVKVVVIITTDKVYKIKNSDLGPACRGHFIKIPTWTIILINVPLRRRRTSSRLENWSARNASFPYSPFPLATTVAIYVIALLLRHICA